MFLNGPMEPRSTCCAALCTIVSLALFSSSIISDIILCVQYKRDNQLTYFGVTLAILLMSSVFVNFLSYKWHSYDGEPSCCRLLLSVLQLGVLHRHLVVFRICIKRPRDMDTEGHCTLTKRTRDLCVLHLYEAFLKSAPQLAFQLYLIYDTDGWNRTTVVSASLSLLSLCWAVIDYDIASWRQHYEGDEDCRYRLWLTLHEFGRILVVASRIIATAMMIIADDERAIWLFGANCILTLIFVVVLKKAGAIPSSQDWRDLAECIHSAAATAAFTFCFIDVGGSSFLTLLVLLYVHGAYQSGECIWEFISERIKHGAALHGYLSSVVMASFLIGATCICVSIWKCKKVQRVACIFPNKETLAEVLTPLGK